MAKAFSSPPDARSAVARATPRTDQRRRATVAAALQHAVAILESDGAGAVTMSEIARRLEMRPPSLYKYFSSLHAVYDALFARGYLEMTGFVADKARVADVGLARLRAESEALLRWADANRGLAQLMFSRPVPGFEPSAASFAHSQAIWRQFRADLTAAAVQGELDRSADSDEVMALLTVLISGISSQQSANEPEADFDRGRFTRLTGAALDMFVQHHSPTPPREET